MAGRRTASVVNFERLRQELSWALDELELELGRERAFERVAVDADTSPDTCPVDSTAYTVVTVSGS